MTEIAKSKSRALSERVARRNKENQSVLDQMGVSYRSSEDLHCEDIGQVSISDKPSNCAACGGKGKVKSLFSYWDCADCFGTGFDMTNPIAVIKWQTACMDWAKAELVKLRSEVYRLSTTEAERKEKDLNEFYKDAKRKD